MVGVKHSPKKHHHKSKVTPPGLLNSPLIHGLINLIPLVLLISLASVNFSSKGDNFKQLSLSQGFSKTSQSLTNLAVSAAVAGDHPLAQQLLAQSNNSRAQVLGSSSDLDKIIYPKETAYQEISYLKSLVDIEPSRAIYLKLAVLYWRLGEPDQSQLFIDQAKTLDPNSEQISTVSQALGY
jgi:Tfp pilus assembly protein PilF